MYVPVCVLIYATCVLYIHMYICTILECMHMYVRIHIQVKSYLKTVTMCWRRVMEVAIIALTKIAVLTDVIWWTQETTCSNVVVDLLSATGSLWY